MSKRGQIERAFVGGEFDWVCLFSLSLQMKWAVGGFLVSIYIPFVNIYIAGYEKYVWIIEQQRLRYWCYRLA